MTSAATTSSRTSPLVVVFGMLVAVGFVGSVWLLPPGDVLWPAALLAVALPAVVGGLVAPKSTPRLGRPHPGQPAGVFLGVGVALLPLPFSGLPYRPDLLLPLLAVAVVAAHALVAVQLIRCGWPLSRALVVAVASSVVTLLAAGAGLFL